jgi:hypothetical protein
MVIGVRAKAQLLLGQISKKKLKMSPVRFQVESAKVSNNAEMP